MWKSQLIWIGDLVIASQRLEQEHKKKLCVTFVEIVKQKKSTKKPRNQSSKIILSYYNYM